MHCGQCHALVAFDEELPFRYAVGESSGLQGQIRVLVVSVARWPDKRCF